MAVSRHALRNAERMKQARQDAERDRATTEVRQAYRRLNGSEPGNPEGYVTTVNGQTSVDVARMVEEGMRL